MSNLFNSVKVTDLAPVFSVKVTDLAPVLEGAANSAYHLGPVVQSIVSLTSSLRRPTVIFFLRILC